MEDIYFIGEIKAQPLEQEFGNLKTHEVIVTKERVDHIKGHHPQDVELFKKYAADTLADPDMIIKDLKNPETVFMIKKLENTNLNVVTKLVLSESSDKILNSVISFYRIRDKNLKKLENKNKLLYKRE